MTQADDLIIMNKDAVPENVPQQPQLAGIIYILGGLMCFIGALFLGYDIGASAVCTKLATVLRKVMTMVSACIASLCCAIFASLKMWVSACFHSTAIVTAELFVHPASVKRTLLCCCLHLVQRQSHTQRASTARHAEERTHCMRHTCMLAA